MTAELIERRRHRHLLGPHVRSCVRPRCLVSVACSFGSRYSALDFDKNYVSCTPFDLISSFLDAFAQVD